jgi:dTDP-4-amino-4,6-dideoxygalactose transaminase
VTVPVSDPKRTAAAERDQIVEALTRVVDSGRYILGGEVSSFEEEFSAYVGGSFGVAVASGTDALTLALMALGLPAGERVIIPANTAFPTACAVTRAGGVPVFVDVDPETATVDPQALDALLTKTAKTGGDPKVRGVIPVHLYGHPCDMDPIMTLAERHGLFVLEDCAQAHGALYKGRKVGTFGQAAAFSFYPTKNLAALGDAGMVVTGDGALTGRLKSMRDYGQRERYLHEDHGLNSRMDDLQAAVLRKRLGDLDEKNERRRQIARIYHEAIRGPYTLPLERPYARHVYHLFVIRSRHRKSLIDHLARSGVGHAIHYPRPIHLQPVYRHLGYRLGDFPVTEGLSEQILSIPMFPELTDTEVQRVITALNDFSDGNDK